MNVNGLKYIIKCESRFKEVAGLECDLTQYPIQRSDNLQTSTNKSKSDEFGEVFTPLWLVDEMLDKVYHNKNDMQELTTLDLCAGYGQFTIRMLRKLYSEYDGSITKFIKNHYLSELQLSSVYKLIYIFSPLINICIGDSRFLNCCPADIKGINYYSEHHKKWINITDKVKELYPNAAPKFDVKKCEQFVNDLTEYMNQIEKGEVQ